MTTRTANERSRSRHKKSSVTVLTVNKKMGLKLRQNVLAVSAANTSKLNNIWLLPAVHSENTKLVVAFSQFKRYGRQTQNACSACCSIRPLALNKTGLMSFVY